MKIAWCLLHGFAAAFLVLPEPASGFAPILAVRRFVLPRGRASAIAAKQAGFRAGPRTRITMAGDMSSIAGLAAFLDASPTPYQVLP